MHTLFLPVSGVGTVTVALISKEIVGNFHTVVSQEIISIAAFIRRLHYVLHELLHS